MKAITKTKLICTIGPASNDPTVIRKMIENGMNVVRLNFRTAHMKATEQQLNL